MHIPATDTPKRTKPSGIYRSGTSGLVLAEPNKLSYPECYRQSSRLTYYASLFNSVEVNSSFYRIPRQITFARWAKEVPDDFRFTVKMWKGITHAKDFAFREEDVSTFMQAIAGIGDKAGCLLVQFARTTRFDLPAFHRLLGLIRCYEKSVAWRLAVEFRHNDWYTPEVFTLLDTYDASLVLHDMPLSAPERLNDKAPFVYLRFHGIKGDFRGSYSDAFLQEKASMIKKWLEAKRDVYVYFNNTIGDAVSNLKTLNRLVVNS